VFLIDNPDDPAHPKVKLLDWGIAKVITTDVKHTVDGQLVGTPQYLAPEQARGAAVSAQTDVYSLGVMAYELFLEQLPFEAETSAEIMAMHLRALPPTPSELWPDIPPTLEHLLLGMLAKCPDARPSMLTVAHTLEVVRDELDARREQVGAAGEPESPVRLSRRISAPALAPTEPAMYERRKPWQFVVGALAIAASATMFLITRDSDSAAATRPSAAVLDSTATAVAAPRIAPPLPVAPPPVAEQRMVAARPAAVVEHAVTPEVDHAPPHAKPARLHHASHASRKAPVTPRRVALPLDPDGTLDPYR
jgi:serine/threonine-protein kinase